MARFKPTRFIAEDSKYDKKAADYAVSFIECLSHTKGTWAGKKFELLDWQEQIIRDLFGILKPNGYRQFNTAYIEIPKKNGKSELAAAVALLLTCGDGEERAEVYGCAADRQQAAIVFDVAADMVRMCPALSKRVKILTSQKRIVYIPTNSFYQVLSAEAYSKHGFNIHGVVFDDMSPPTKELMKLTLEQTLAHNGHPVLRWMMDNIFIRRDPAGNIKPDKEKSTEKIDGAVAMIMALDRAIRCGCVSDESVYDTREMLIL